MSGHSEPFVGVTFTAEEIGAALLSSWLREATARDVVDHDQYEFNGRPVASSSLPEWFRRTMRIRAWRAHA